MMLEIKGLDRWQFAVQKVIKINRKCVMQAEIPGAFRSPFTITTRIFISVAAQPPLESHCDFQFSLSGIHRVHGLAFVRYISSCCTVFEAQIISCRIVSRGPFLESPGTFSGPKSQLKKVRS